MSKRAAASTLPTTGFRTDINGMRAWAVALVMFYHFGLPGFPGGFVGVDVFLVISGFLMTSIITHGLASGHFRLWKFLGARVRRILPALLVLCGILLTLGWYCLNATEYQQLAAEAFYSIGFVSNITYWNEAGYFDTAAQDKWMLHTWSLSLEAQFYLFVPVLLMIPWAIKPSSDSVRRVIIWGAILSYSISVLITPDIPSAAFYLLPARCWEFLAGGIVALNTGRSLSTYFRRVVEGVGFLLVMASATLITRNDTWPGALSLLPVAGAMLIIFAARPASALTSGKVAQWLGTRSYSAYLWHWPLVVLLSYLNCLSEPLGIAAGIILTLVLADISYRWFERIPGRWLDHWQPLPWAILIAVAASLGTAAALIEGAAGVPGRLPQSVDLIAAESKNRHPADSHCLDSWASPGTACLYGGSRIVAVLVGDSHAFAVASALAAARTDMQSGVLALIYPGCVTIFSAKMTNGVFRAGRACSQFNRAVREKLETLPGEIPVVLVSRTTVYAFGLKGEIGDAPDRPAVYFTKEYAKPEPAFLSEFSTELTKSACELKRHRQVYLVRPIPEMNVDVPKTVARALAMGLVYEPKIVESGYLARHKVVMSAQDKAAESCDVKILDPRPYLCKSGVCPGVIDGRPIYYDDDHLSEYGNKFLVPMFRAVFPIDAAKDKQTPGQLE